jgi:hypothetical protein
MRESVFDSHCTCPSSFSDGSITAEGTNGETPKKPILLVLAIHASRDQLTGGCFSLTLLRRLYYALMTLRSKVTESRLLKPKEDPIETLFKSAKRIVG